MSSRLPVRRFSDAWFEALADDRFLGPWSTPRGPKLPTLPWVTMPMPPELRAFFLLYGEPKRLAPGEMLFPTSQVTGFAYVASGLVGRIAATADGQSGTPAMALAASNSLAAGGLNWLTRRPSVGRYAALAHAEIWYLPHPQAEELLRGIESARLHSLLIYLEMLHLSNRLGFALLALLPARQRLEAFFLAWASLYGRPEFDGAGDLWTVMPAPGRRAAIEAVISVSSVTLDKILQQLMTEGVYERHGDFVRLRVSALQAAHDWMRHVDGDAVLYSRPALVEDFFADVCSGRYV